MKYELQCTHEGAILKREETNAGIIFRCPKCDCVFRLNEAHNDTKCWNKRFPVKK